MSGRCSRCDRGRLRFWKRAGNSGMFPELSDDSVAAEIVALARRIESRALAALNGPRERENTPEFAYAQGQYDAAREVVTALEAASARPDSSIVGRADKAARSPGSPE